MIDEKLDWQDENSMRKMRKQIAKVSTPKQNKRAIKVEL
jgi:ribosomal protein L29